MKTINLQEIIKSKIPGIFEKYPKYLTSLLLKFLNKQLHVSEVNKFLERNAGLYGHDFLDEMFEQLDFSYYMMSKEKDRIPNEGRLIVVANHPLGGLDGLAIVKAIAEVRQDVRIVANDILMNLDNLKELFLPYDVYSKTPQKTNISKIMEALNNEEVVIFFPAAEVSRLTINGIKDRDWRVGAARLALKCKAPILPMYVKARNSLQFYLLSLLYKKIGTFMLPSELFKKENQNITFRIGKVIPYQELEKFGNDTQLLSELLKQHTYNIGNDDEEFFRTENTIIHPVETRKIINELSNTRLLGYTNDKKCIYLAENDKAPNVIREISRLRELTFRKVEEGTGLSRDYDPCDDYYKHIVLWDEVENEIVGSYRLGIAKDIVKKHGKAGLFNSRKFEFSDDFDEYLKQSIEVGRSFIQQKYWGTSALDYMWQGIGAFLNEFPEIKYLWGTVSMSSAFPKTAKNLIVFYYSKWYAGDKKLALPYVEYKMTDDELKNIEPLFTGSTPQEDFFILKSLLKPINQKVPVLYRKYAEICEYGGVEFVNFCIDTGFNNSIDAFIIVDLSKLKQDVRNRYYTDQRSFKHIEYEKTY